MAIKDWFSQPKQVAEAKITTKPAIYITEDFKSVPAEEQKSISTEKIGIDHPFNMDETERWYKDDAFVTGIVDKYVDYILGGGFHPVSDDEVAKGIIEQFIQDNNLKLTLKPFVTNGLVYGNGYTEITPDNKTIKMTVVNSKTMYIRRDEKGNILEYNQLIYKNKEPIHFTPDEIIHFAHKKVGSNPYGYGVIFPLLYYLKRKAKLYEDMVKIMGKKANSPYVFTLGSKEEPAKQGDVTEFGKKTETLNNKDEWTFNHLVDVKHEDFGAIGDKFVEPLNLINQELIAGAQVPEVLLGRGNIPEGLAKVQSEAFERRVQSIQDELEKVIEGLFDRVLELNGIIGVHVELEWGQPSDDEKRAEIQTITNLLDARIGIFGDLRTKLEQRLAELLGFDELAETPEEEKSAEMEARQPALPQKFKSAVKA